MHKTPKSGSKKPLLIFFIIVSVPIAGILLFGAVHYGSELVKSGFKSAAKNTGNSFQFSTDAAEAHAELRTYFRTNNYYPTTAVGIKYSKFRYQATPADCNNQAIICNGYIITHKDYNKSQTNADAR